MSRYVIPNAPGSPEGRETTVGWDAPLNTFFAMAFDPPPSRDLEDDEVEVFRHGTTPGEIPTVEALDAVLRGHGVTLPFQAAMVLAMDKKHEGDQSQGRPGTALITALTERGGAR